MITIRTLRDVVDAVRTAVIYDPDNMRGKSR